MADLPRMTAARALAWSMESPLSWAVERRLDYIDWRRATVGEISRADLVRTFGVHVNQATDDLKLYMERHPGALTYDRRQRRYVSTTDGPCRQLPSGADIAKLARVMRWE